ncbi:MAG TPA: hypothetical protein VM387_07585, partial [Gemmatimonadales bacterium]|nr:hypothetical protein [Gemmatimonadales bacterium]
MTFSEIEFLREVTGLNGSLSFLREKFYGGVLDGSISLGGGGGVPQLPPGPTAYSLPGVDTLLGRVDTAHTMGKVFM